MGKQKKFLTIREAIRDIIDSFLRPDCVEEIAEIYSFLEGGKARPNKGTHPLMDNKAPRIMYKPEKLDYEEFYDWREFEDLLTRALEDKLPEDVPVYIQKSSGSIHILVRVLKAVKKGFGWKRKWKTLIVNSAVIVA